MVEMGWVVPTKGPCGGKVWALTALGRSLVRDEQEIRERRAKRSAARVAKQRREELERTDRIWSEQPNPYPGITTEGDTLVVTARLASSSDVAELIRVLGLAKGAMFTRRYSRPK